MENNKLIEYSDFHKLWEDNDMSELSNHNCRIYQLLRNCRNDLCIQCGRYTREHEGACNNCCWRIEYDS